jgi:hypothetical protein
MFSREAIAVATDRKHEKFHSDYDSWGVLENMVRRCQKEGFFPKSADVGILSLLGWAEVHGLALLCNEGAIETMAHERTGTGGGTLEKIFAVMKGRLRK